MMKLTRRSILAGTVSLTGLAVSACRRLMNWSITGHCGCPPVGSPLMVLS
jgi:hypothetical protein